MVLLNVRTETTTLNRLHCGSPRVKNSAIKKTFCGISPSGVSKFTMAVFASAGGQLVGSASNHEPKCAESAPQETNFGSLGGQVLKDRTSSLHFSSEERPPTQKTSIQWECKRNPNKNPLGKGFPVKACALRKNEQQSNKNPTGLLIGSPNPGFLEGISCSTLEGFGEKRGKEGTFGMTKKNDLRSFRAVFRES